MKDYDFIQDLGRCAQDNSILSLVIQKSSKKYLMSKKLLLFSQQISHQQQLLNQACLLKQLHHPHIIKYHNILLQQNNLIQILQFCEYGDIGSYLLKKKQRNQILSQKLLISWLMQILMALEYLNQKKLVHRLLTTNNIYMNYQGDLKLGSFGKAKRLENTLQKAHTIVGQPCAMSPEMIQGKEYDSKSDIWSLGCLVYQMATYEAPFKYGNLMKLYDSIVRQPCPQLPLKYSKFLSPLYKKMMKKNPSARPSASQLLEDEIFSSLMKQYLKKKKIDSIDLKKIQPKPLIVHKNRVLQGKKAKVTLEPISSSRVSTKGPIKTQKSQQDKKIISRLKTKPQQLKIAKSPRLQKLSEKQVANQKLQKLSEKQVGHQKLQKKQSLAQKYLQNQFIESSNRTQQKSMQQSQAEYISLLYQVKLCKLEEKYQPNMSKIFQRTVQFDSFKDLV